MLFDKDINEKPTYYAVREALFNGLSQTIDMQPQLYFNISNEDGYDNASSASFTVNRDVEVELE